MVQEDDEGYTQSFGLGDLEGEEGPAKQFFERFGFVVVRDVLTPQDCQNTVSEIFDIIEHKSPTFNRKDRSTWDAFPTDDAIPQYGSPSRPPIFTRQFLMNRQNENVYRVFSTFLNNKDLMVNNDRCCFFRPTVDAPGALGKPAWATKSNLHLDMNPFNWMGDGKACRAELDRLRYVKHSEFIVENNSPSHLDGVQLQGVLNLMDNQQLDGGYIVVPGFHHHFVEFFREKKPDFNSVSWNWNQKDVLFKLAKRISMRVGSIVIWDQRMPHGSANNTSSNPRMAQFIKIYPRSTVSQARYDSRARTVSSILKSMPEPFPLTDIGASLFGVKELV
eukprot:gene13656-16081_t